MVKEKISRRVGRLALAAMAAAAAAPSPAAVTHTLTLYVANQSFDVNPVDIRVTVDGEPVAEGAFYAGHGRNWRRFDVPLSPGRHVLRAVTRKGAAGFKQELNVTGPRWAALAYRNRSPASGAGVPRHFAFIVRDKAFGE